jgi:hypothetical protein
MFSFSSFSSDGDVVINGVRLSGISNAVVNGVQLSGAPGSYIINGVEYKADAIKLKLEVTDLAGKVVGYLEPNQPINIKMDQPGQSLEIKASGSSINVDAPHELSKVSATTSNAKIHVAHAGRVDKCKTSNGAISIDSAETVGDCETSNGAITVRAKTVGDCTTSNAKVHHIPAKSLFLPFHLITSSFPSNNLFLSFLFPSIYRMSQPFLIGGYSQTAYVSRLVAKSDDKTGIILSFTFRTNDGAGGRVYNVFNPNEEAELPAQAGQTQKTLEMIEGFDTIRYTLIGDPSNKLAQRLVAMYFYKNRKVVGYVNGGEKLGWPNDFPGDETKYVFVPPGQIARMLNVEMEYRPYLHYPLNLVGMEDPAKTPVDYSWSDWVGWTPATNPCGPSTCSRTRTCNPPLFGGALSSTNRNRNDLVFKWSMSR